MVREIAKKGWSGLTRSEDVSTALAILEEKGWVIGVERLPGPEGGRRTTVYHVNPRARGKGAMADKPALEPREARADA
jgi:hypothetical protein